MSMNKEDAQLLLNKINEKKEKEYAKLLYKDLLNYIEQIDAQLTSAYGRDFTALVQLKLSLLNSKKTFEVLEEFEKLDIKN